MPLLQFCITLNDHRCVVNVCRYVLGLTHVVKCEKWNLALMYHFATGPDSGFKDKQQIPGLCCHNVLESKSTDLCATPLGGRLHRDWCDLIVNTGACMAPLSFGAISRKKGSTMMAGMNGRGQLRGMWDRRSAGRWHGCGCRDQGCILRADAWR